MRRVALLSLFGGVLACATLRTDHGAEKRWWKGNTHTHTLWSDGDSAPELAARWYLERGYDFLVLSDHNVLSEGERWYPVGEEGHLSEQRLLEIEEDFGAGWIELREREDGVYEMRLKTLAELRERFEVPGEFLFVTGEEISATHEAAPVHVNGLNLAEPIDPRSGATLLETLQANVDAILDQGRRVGRPVLAHVNHPNYNWALTADEVARIRGGRFFEVYNGHPWVNNEGDDEHPSTEHMWDIALTLRLTELDLGLLYGLAVDDTHAFYPYDRELPTPGRGWIWVRAERLDAEHLIDAMRAGDFYASSGVRLHDVSSDGERLVVEVAAEEGETYTTTFVGTHRRGDGIGEIGEVLLETTENPAVYVFHGDELYVRAKVVSSRPHPLPYEDGARIAAWVQPVVPRTN